MILLFSGTGNSRLVARQLSTHIPSEIIDLRGDILCHPHNNTLTPSADEPIIWVMPCYSWGIPPVMARFIRKIKIKGGFTNRHYLVITCGDDIGYADHQWQKLIGRRGWSPMAAFSVQMPNTYVSMPGFDIDSQEIADKKLAAMPARVALIADHILRGSTTSDVVRGSFPWPKTYIVYPWFRAFNMSPRHFAVDTGRCTHCHACAATCPTLNISNLNPEKPSFIPRWGDNCAHCLACYHVCPAHAISYRGVTTASKGQKPLYR